MRFRCPQCNTWQALPPERREEGTELTCAECGALLVLGVQDTAQGPHWEATVRPDKAVAVRGEDPLTALLHETEGRSGGARTEALTGLGAQLVAMTVGASPRLWLPAAALVALGLVVGVGLLVVGQRVERSLALLLSPLAVGIVAFAMVVAASAVANLLHMRLGGSGVGMGRSLRMIAEHGNGSLGSALRFIIIGVVGATLCGLITLLGAFPGLGGPGGLALTGALLWLQLLAVGAALLILGLMAVALLVHPGLSAVSKARPGQIFRFVLSLLLRETRDVVRLAALPLGAALATLLLGSWLLRAALGTAVALNHRILGAGYADLIAASPIRVLYGTPELLDPPLSLTIGGLAMAVSLTLATGVVLGYVASFLGTSGYLLARGLDLPEKLARHR